MKLYLVTRADLSAGQQAAQATHAAIEAARADTPAVRAWHLDSNTVVLVVVDGAPQLERLARQALIAGCEVHAFREPDLGDELTAIAMLGATAGRVCRGLPLLGATSGP